MPIKFEIDPVICSQVTTAAIFENVWRKIRLRMLYAYIPSQKFGTVKISVLRDITKIWKKSTI